MTGTVLESGKGRLLNTLQSGFPFVSRPFDVLGEQLDVDGGEVIRRVQELKAEDIIREIGPLFDARKLDFTTTLAAMKVSADNYDAAVRVLVNHPGVSHAYERHHEFNIWFTLALPASIIIEEEFKRMFAGIKVESVFSLPAVKLFKLRTYFDTSGQGQTAADDHEMDISPQALEISEADRKVINELQQDLPLVEQPFKAMAEKLGMDEDEFLDTCESLLARGIIRRFSASINHRQVGFAANGMACWVVPEDKVDDIGRKLTSLREVSHCYERATNPLWKHNVFAMIHSQTEEECLEIAATVTKQAGLEDPLVLFSTRELKKERVKYLV